MRKGDFDGYDHFADHHFAYTDFVWWRLLRSRSLEVADSIAPNSQAHRGLKEARLAGQPSPGFRVFGGTLVAACSASGAGYTLGIQLFPKRSPNQGS
jgi:hypothetical protein